MKKLKRNIVLVFGLELCGSKMNNNYQLLQESLKPINESHTQIYGAYQDFKKWWASPESIPFKDKVKSIGKGTMYTALTLLSVGAVGMFLYVLFEKYRRKYSDAEAKQKLLNKLERERKILTSDPNAPININSKINQLVDKVKTFK